MERAAKAWAEESGREKPDQRKINDKFWKIDSARRTAEAIFKQHLPDIDRVELSLCLFQFESACKTAATSATRADKRALDAARSAVQAVAGDASTLTSRKSRETSKEIRRLIDGLREDR